MLALPISNEQIVLAVDVSRPCVERIRKHFVEGSLERTLVENFLNCSRDLLDCPNIRFLKNQINIMYIIIFLINRVNTHFLY